MKGALTPKDMLVEKNKNKYLQLGKLITIGDIESPIEYVYLIGDWGFMSLDNRTKEKKSLNPFLGRISSIGDMRSPTGNILSKYDFLFQVSTVWLFLLP